MPSRLRYSRITWVLADVVGRQHLGRSANFRLRDSQNTAGELLRGIWLFPLAVLVYKSRFLPRFLGVWLAIGGFAWVALSVVGTLWPQYQGEVFTIAQPATLCEIAFTLWLVIKGATPTQTDKLR